jgi:bifunctional UDP-N-acetylglucosamine pyrophosphorylase/glucosamine-1-phosphate N-acetyltransferase
MEYIDQEKSATIGEALYCARESFMPGEYFMLIYADVVTSENIYSTLLRSFNTFREPMASVCLTPSTKNYGNIFLGEEMRITRIIEKPPRDDMGNYVLAGVYILPQQFFPLLEKCSCKMEDALNLLIEEIGFRASIWEKPWKDIRYPWDILTGNKMIMDSWEEAQIHHSVRLIGDVKVEGPAHIDEDVEIHSGTVVKGPCYIGRGCFIGNNTLIRPYTSIGPHSSIGYGMELKNCVIFSNAVVGRLSFIGDSVVGEGADIGSGTMTINRKLDSSPIDVILNEEKVSTGLTKLGAFIGDGVKIGASNTLGAGSIISANSEIGHNFSWPDKNKGRPEVS